MYFLKIYFYLYADMFVICACLCEYMPHMVRNTQRPEGGVGSTGAAAQAAVSLQPGFWEPDLDPLEKQQALYLLSYLSGPSVVLFIVLLLMPK